MKRNFNVQRQKKHVRSSQTRSYIYTRTIQVEEPQQSIGPVTLIEISSSCYLSHSAILAGAKNAFSFYCFCLTVDIVYPRALE